MTSGSGRIPPVELRPVPGEGADRLDAYVAGRRLALLRVNTVGAPLLTFVVLDPQSVFAVDDLIALLQALGDYGRSHGAATVSLLSPSVLLRSLARRFGFDGGLREPLEAALDGTYLSSPLGTGAPQGPDDDIQTVLLHALEDFGVRASRPRSAGAVARLGRRLSGGVPSTIGVDVEWLPGRTFRLSVPERSDLMDEAVARCADTAVSVLRRLAPPSAVVREIVFDRSSSGLVSGTEGGHARNQTYEIHLNVAYCAAYASLELHAKRSGSSPEGAMPGGVQLPFTVIDATVAHEIWHLVENDFAARHFAHSAEFRRELGHSLGVDTLEQAVKGANPKAPEAWQAAHRRLVTEVSPYGATNALEATAEMFKAWWCRSGDVTPIVARFEDLVSRYFPEP